MDELTPAQREEAHVMAEASMRALDVPGGQEILDRMLDGSMEVADGLAALLILSGEYERV